MSLPDYEIHLTGKQFSDLWDEDEESSAALFFEDPEEIDRIIEEEIGKPKRGRKRKNR
ncbi:hypothetical protein LAV_00006 [Sphingobium phage Lacusarx]|uniref:Uncharacterized protein n=1 Tax=Sphingobium phage Lacusarx TaxID=1980139 RepID=A0A1W6DX13_9CAUD|nr:hypothetical protein FDH44_gp006 [Sphingobium phage Lacusarx]ARK07406.1 hypothetical protein LAV_00006 [Sphingobium phage Lacusarx]